MISYDEIQAQATTRDDLHRAEQDGITVGTRVWTDGGHEGRISAIHADATATVELDQRYQAGGQTEVREPIRLLLPTA